MRSRINVPRIIVAGTASGVGKTTVSLALMSAFSRAGDKVQPFKAGPDYIDPGYHRAVTGRISRNLDTHLVTDESNVEIFAHAAIDADIAVIEGVMGLYDGAAGSEGTTASLAKVIGAPIILVLNCAGAGQSIAAVAAGFRAFDPGLRLAGVILNRIGGKRHLEIIKESLDNVDIPVLGWLGRDNDISLRERHLGLVPYGEESDIISATDLIKSVAIEDLDLRKIRKIAADAPPLVYGNHLFNEVPSRRIRIGIARDKAFNFYYQDNLDILKKAGAELVEFSPLRDERLPSDIDGLYFGGGFPEVFVDELAGNQPMLQAVRKAIDGDLPTYAECGGLIYLTAGLTTGGGEVKTMCGVIAARSRFTPGLKSLGYRRALSLSDNLLTVKGGAVTGHEFHYCVLIDINKTSQRAYMIEKLGDANSAEGFARGNLLASFIHVHFGSDRGWAERFIDRAALRTREAV